MRRAATGTLGAAIEADCALDPADERTRRRIAELVLGVQPTAPLGTSALRPPDIPDDTDVPGQRDKDGGGGRSRLEVLEAVADRALAAAEGALSRFRELGLRRRREEPVPSELIQLAFEPRSDTKAEVLGSPSLEVEPPVEPLFLPRWTTGIVTAALAMEMNDGPLDAERLVDDLARLRVPSRLPRRSRRSINVDARVLVDFSDDMLPFRADIIMMLRKLRRLFGADRLTVLRFAGRPFSQIGPGRRATWGRHEPPGVPQPVLIITNFQMSGPWIGSPDDAFAREWVPLLAELRRDACQVVALVPNAAARVPRQIRRILPVVEWDRTTTAASAGRAARG